MMKTVVREEDGNEDEAFEPEAQRRNETKLCCQQQE